MKIKYGDIYWHKIRNKFYMISKINIHHVHMTDVTTGDSFNSSVYVNDPSNISMDEFDKLIGHARISQFEYVGSAYERISIRFT